MLPSLLVAAAVTAPGAPVPKDTVPNPTGPAPRVVAVKADAAGAVWITAHVYEKRKVKQSYVTVENGKQVVKTQDVEQLTSNYVRKTLGDFGGKFATADGTPISTEDATRRVKDGATLLITADGKPVSPGWLKAVRGDTVVMTAEGLAEAHFQYGAAPLPTTAAPRLAMLGTDEKGEVRLPVNPNGASAGGPVYYDNFEGRGGRIIKGRAIMLQGDVAYIDGGAAAPPSTTPPGPDGKKALADIKFDAYDVDGKLIPRGEALNRLKAGGLVVLAGDNRFPDPEHLKAFRDDLLVIVSGELVFPAGTPNPYDYRVNKPAAAPPAAGGKPGLIAPAPPVQAVPLPAIGVAKPAIIKRVQIDK
jgi:hypothetical protein